MATQVQSHLTGRTTIGLPAYDKGVQGIQRIRMWSYD
jgi:hypothetical protein